jgi:hypothetical protein
LLLALFFFFLLSFFSLIHLDDPVAEGVLHHDVLDQLGVDAGQVLGHTEQVGKKDKELKESAKLWYIY